MSNIDKKSKGMLKKIAILGGLAAVAGYGVYYVFWKGANDDSGNQEELIKKETCPTTMSDDAKEESIAETKPSVRFDDHSSDNGLRSRIMAHRGLHHRGAGNNERPLENTMAAYVEAEKNGYVLGECDITISSDRKIFLIHNDTLKSLAADPTVSITQRKVLDLTWEEISSVPLNDGGDNSTRCVLLEDVLNFCARSKLRMMVELKKSAGLPLVDRVAEFFTEKPNLLQYVFCFACFEPSLMGALKQKMKPMGVDLPLFFGLYFNKKIKYQSDESYIDISEDSWMEKLLQQKEKHGLDAFYLEYDSRWNDYPERTRKLTSSFFVATWVRGNTPLEKDTYAWVDHCLSLGIRVVNSDLPYTFWDTKSSKASISVLDERKELAGCNVILEKEIQNNAMDANADKVKDSK